MLRRLMTLPWEEKTEKIQLCLPFWLSEPWKAPRSVFVHTVSAVSTFWNIAKFKFLPMYTTFRERSQKKTENIWKYLVYLILFWLDISAAAPRLKCFQFDKFIWLNHCRWVRILFSQYNLHPWLLCAFKLLGDPSTWQARIRSGAFGPNTLRGLQPVYTLWYAPCRRKMG